MNKTNEEQVLEKISELIKGTEFENKVFLAGGSVRDEIMGLKPKDLDFTILGNNINSGINFSIWLAKQLNVFKEGSNPVIYERFGTAALHLKGNKFNLPELELEFVAPRKEEYDGKSRKPIVSAGTLEDDVLRRDLTINSLLKNISTNEIIDLTGKGINDIKNGLIRTTESPEKIFKEDPLRMLRFIRFIAKYNFKFDLDDVKFIQKNTHLINNISKERVKDELNKMLITNNPKKAIRLLKITGLLKEILPDMQKSVGMKQNKYHKDDVFNHSLDVLSKVPPNIKTRLIALFHDIGKVLTKTVSPEGAVHFYGHEEVGENMVKTIMKNLKYPNEMIDAVANGVRNHMYLKHGGDNANISVKTLRKFAHRVGENLEDLLDVIHADNISHSEESSMPNQIELVRKNLKEIETEIKSNKPKLPINGKDLIAIGFKTDKQNAPLIGKALKDVEDAWYENPKISKQTALEIAKKYI